MFFEIPFPCFSSPYGIPNTRHVSPIYQQPYVSCHFLCSQLFFNTDQDISYCSIFQFTNPLSPVKPTLAVLGYCKLFSFGIPI